MIEMHDQSSLLADIAYLILMRWRLTPLSPPRPLGTGYWVRRAPTFYRARELLPALGGGHRSRSHPQVQCVNDEIGDAPNERGKAGVKSGRLRRQECDEWTYSTRLPLRSPRLGPNPRARLPSGC
jgi:hypothetical protein